MKNIKIENQLPSNLKDELCSLLNSKIEFILLGGNFGITSTYDPSNFDEVKYAVNEMSIITSSKGKGVKEISMMSTLIGKDVYGEYDHLHLKIFGYDEKALRSLEISQRLLVKNRGLLTLSVPPELFINSIDIYGVNVNNHLEIDEDFPEDKALLNIDLDLLLRFNTNMDFFITGHAKNGQILLTFYQSQEIFENYIAITQNHWGKLHGYNLKYSLSK